MRPVATIAVVAAAVAAVLVAFLLAHDAYQATNQTWPEEQRDDFVAYCADTGLNEGACDCMQELLEQRMPWSDVTNRPRFYQEVTRHVAAVCVEQRLR